ncbi:hypothetical protein HDU79_002884 [Rhizoclosmatium sp. JEL0117]|nr:hypothetical protein HDU79_002884 [Rhizoclosmatium sp. JEL0117]
MPDPIRLTGGKFFFVFTVLALVMLLGVLHASMFGMAGSMPHRSVQPKPQNTVCYILIDSRLKPYHHEIAQFTAVEELTEYISEDLRKPVVNQTVTEYWTLSTLLVKHYALQHGYKVITSNGEAYAANMTKLGQNDYWGRVHLLWDLMNNASTPCDWFAYGDSDVFPYMKLHTKSLEEFFSTKRVAPESHNYKQRELQRNTTGKYTPWHLQEESFIIGMNGEFETKNFPDRKYFTRYIDYICSGVFFVKNNDVGKRLIEDWMFGAKDLDEDEKDIHEKAGTQLSKDQWAFNNGVLQRYYNVTSIYVFNEFNSRNMGAIRHVWSIFGGERIPLMSSLLKELDVWPDI